MAIQFESGPKVQTKSTAPRKDVARLAEDRTATASEAPTKQRAKYGGGAGTQALPVDTLIDEWTASVIQKHKDRLAYQAQYQRWLRAASKLGISVKQYREGKR